MKVRFMSTNENGDFYVGYLMENVARGLHGKTKGHVDELLIIGIPRKRFKDWLKKHLDDMEFIGNE